MKKLLTSLLVIISILSFGIINPTKLSALSPLDYINAYDITVIPNDDGTLEMTYHINWTVLNDEDEGPLSWVKVGIWNKEVENLKAESDVISKIESDDEYIKVYFKKEYYKNETVDFTFSFRQKYAFYMDNGYVEYSFIAGWFDDIQVEKCTIRWKAKAKDYFFADCQKDDGEYLIWEKSLDYGEKMKAQVKYELGYFNNLDVNQDYKVYSRVKTIRTILIVVAIIMSVVGLFILLAYLIRQDSDGYDYYCGFTGRNYIYHRYRPMHSPGVNRKGNAVKTYTSTQVGSSSSGYTAGGGHSCACACACACAGGGRAGCSRKDFTNSKQLEES